MLKKKNFYFSELLTNGALQLEVGEFPPVRTGWREHKPTLQQPSFHLKINVVHDFPAGTHRGREKEADCLRCGWGECTRSGLLNSRVLISPLLVCIRRYLLPKKKYSAPDPPHTGCLDSCLHHLKPRKKPGLIQRSPGNILYENQNENNFWLY